MFLKFRNYLNELYYLHPQAVQFSSLLLLVLLTLFLFETLTPAQKQIEAPAGVEEATTYIPKNHTLIPLKFVNQKSLSSMIESFGWIDLYALDKDHQDLKFKFIIVKKIRILRAPLDPDQFGIIVPESYVEFILRSGPKYFATLVKNQHHKSELALNKKFKKEVVYGQSL